MVECVNAICDGAGVCNRHNRHNIFIGVRNHSLIATGCTGNPRDWERSAVQDVPHQYETEQVRREEITWSMTAIAIAFECVP